MMKSLGLFSSLFAVSIICLSPLSVEAKIIERTVTVDVQQEMIIESLDLAGNSGMKVWVEIPIETFLPVVGDVIKTQVNFVNPIHFKQLAGSEYFASNATGTKAKEVVDLAYRHVELCDRTDTATNCSLDVISGDISEDTFEYSMISNGKAFNIYSTLPGDTNLTDSSFTLNGITAETTITQLDQELGVFALMISLEASSLSVSGRPGIYDGGNGTVEDPYRIATAESLDNIGNHPEDWDKHFIVTTDINMIGYSYTKALISRQETGYGAYDGVKFSGSFDGNGKVISNLTINGKYTLGLFGYIDVDGVVSNLGLEGVNITSSENDVGGVCGINSGTVENCYVTGSVNGDYHIGGICGTNLEGIIKDSHSFATVNGGTRVGGVCGNNELGRIDNCYSNCNIDGREQVGGLCGLNSGGVIYDSHSSGTVSSDYDQIGGLCGLNHIGTIDNSYSECSVTGDNRIGGLCGESSGTITNSYSTGNITGIEGFLAETETSYYGGLCGDSSGVISNCYSTSNITTKINSHFVGGLCGRNKGTYTNCYSRGNITCESTASSVGGFCGYNQKIITNCYSTGFVTVTTPLQDIGGFCGRNYHTESEIRDCYYLDDTGPYNGAGEPRPIMAMRSWQSFAGWDFAGWVPPEIEAVWNICEDYSYPVLAWQVEGDVCDMARYDGGSGTEEDPYEIATAESLQEVGFHNNDIDKHFVVVADIDLSFYDGSSEFKRFNAIGIDYEQGFSGVFDGGGHTISGLTFRLLNHGYGWGLFRYVGNGGIVKNLTLDNVHLEGVGGGLAHENRGTITNCHVSGFILTDNYDGSTGLLVGHNMGIVENCTTQGSVDGGHAGGLIGHNRNEMENFGIVRNCSSSADVTATIHGGGLIGSNSHATVSNCFATGSVAGDDTAGGLIGNNYGGSVSYSFATGSVIGIRNSGGLIGVIFYQGESPLVRNCYATGDVETTQNYYESTAGGLVGMSRAQYINCYATGKITGSEVVSKGGLIGSTDWHYSPEWDEMFENCFWDIETTGIGVATANETFAGATGLSSGAMKKYDTYYFAGWDFVGEDDNGSDNVWEICDRFIYPILAWSVEGDICEGYYIPGGSGSFGDPFQISTADELMLVGSQTEDLDKHFVLTDDIDLVSYNAANGYPNFNRIGSFDVPFTGRFDGNGYVIDGLMWAGVDADYVGMFGYVGESGMVYDVQLVNSAIDAVDGTNVGFIAGVNEGTIWGCQANGFISGNYSVGGIVGLNLFAALITECGFTGQIDGTFSYTGGVVGNNYGTMYNSLAYGSISGVRHVGGVAGRNNSYGLIDNCYVLGEVTGEKNVGGIAGYNYKSKIYDSFAAAIVEGVGDLDTGAFVGFDFNGEGTFIDCMWDATVNATLDGVGNLAVDPAGIRGKSTVDLQQKATYAGIWDLLTPVWVVRDGLGYPRLKWEVAAGDVAGAWGVGLEDVAKFSENWMKADCAMDANCRAADLDGSGMVDGDDLLILADSWLCE